MWTEIIVNWESEISKCKGRKIAIDASMSLYQFLIAIRQEGNQLLTDSGDTTRSESQQRNLSISLAI